ncbi:MAG: hypothetical protein A3G59_01650 [Candidatus Taylorbacteria bacterium RIFCSPLOWO2_12_FULL_47_20]|uniref:Uncharacterized protein n=1 Tax=Candidatus Taylorbacteria bacterium RIFCSPLOWO2_12_FULL_47_20 TaxID=1802335 RepID=A0A1G2PAH4_9BACT|nr:MAG: hypothetical protein A3G59_01650 [Candidatus Taylorbacteria bacterium RIFCSPLOWO2_12_FULL_47_20]
MLIQAPQFRIVSRVFRNEAGEFYRVYFAVAERDGRLVARPMRVEKVENYEFNLKKEAALLCGKCAVLVYENEVKSAVPSPYPYKDFSFTTVQRPRAPTC